jgi:hypothetical protein
MRKQGGGFGVVLLLVVVAVVLFLATRAWKQVLPTASEIANPSAPDASKTATGEGASSGEVPPVRPSLREMDQRTSEHTDQVRDTLRDSD